MRANRVSALIVAVACAVGCWASAACAQSIDAQELGPRIEQSIAAESLGTFWGGVIVSHNGQPIATYVNGLADKRLRPIDADSLFDIASISKHYTAVAILRLAQDGKLSVNDTVAKYYDVGGKAGSITIQHLLTHTAGLDDRLSIQRLDFQDRDAAVRLAMNSKLASFPGDEYRYSNSGYIILAAIIEKVTGGTYEDYMRGTIFPLAGLKSTGFIDGINLDESRQTARIITSPSGQRRVTTCFTSSGGEPWAWGLRGAGGIVSTLHDMVRWNQALQGDAVLNEASRRTLTTPALEGYACGLEVAATSWGTTRISHSGGTRGYTSQMVSYPAEGIFIACLTGTGANPIKLVERIEQMVFPALRKTASARVQLAGIELGTYFTVEERIAWKVEPAGDDLRLTLANAKDISRMELTVSRSLAKSLADRAASALAGRDLVEGTSEVGLMTIMGPRDESGWMQAFDDAENVRIDVLPSYNNGMDPRATLVIIDEAAGRWPVIVKMSAAHADQLRESLEAALAK